MTWQEHFTERELKEIEYCKVYQRDFNHGTDGHNIRLIVAKMATILNLRDTVLIADNELEEVKRGIFAIPLYLGELPDAPVGAIMMIGDEIWFHYDYGQWSHTKPEQVA